MPENRNITTVFFDAGNTLFRETPYRWEIYAQVGRDEGYAITTQDMRRAMIESHHQLPQRVHGGFRYSDAWFREYIPLVYSRFGVPEERLPAMAEKLFAAFRRPETFQLFPETRQVLEELSRRGVSMGVISNWSPRLPKLLRNLELDRYFEFILSSALEELEKPDRTIFERALSFLGVPPETAIHVGDSYEKDVQGARGAGILGILIDRDQNLEASGDTIRIRSLKELIPILDRGL